MHETLLQFLMRASLPILILLLIFLCMAWLVGEANGTNRWRYDERNPYRRYCKKCGQQQDMYQHALGAVEWCDMSTDHAERHKTAKN